MFWEKQYDFTMIRTTSKDALKRSALAVAGNDIKKASEIYEFFAKDLKDLPDFDIIPPSAFEQVKDAAIQIFNWSKENKAEVAEAVNFVMQLTGKGSLGSAAEILTETPKPIG